MHREMKFSLTYITEQHFWKTGEPLAMKKSPYLPAPVLGWQSFFQSRDRSGDEFLGASFELRVARAMKEDEYADEGEV